MALFNKLLDQSVPLVTVRLIVSILTEQLWPCWSHSFDENCFSHVSHKSYWLHTWTSCNTMLIFFPFSYFFSYFLLKTCSKCPALLVSQEPCWSHWRFYYLVPRKFWRICPMNIGWKTTNICNAAVLVLILATQMKPQVTYFKSTVI